VLLLVVVSLVLFPWRGTFYASAVETTGTVVQITASNGICGNRRPVCTKYRAILEYRVGGRAYRTDTAAGDASGLSQPTARATLGVGERVPVLYATQAPATACRASLWDVWGSPILALVLHLVALLASVLEGRRRSTPGR
jgi:hypothetical protein